METSLLLLSLINRTPSTVSYLSLHSMCRQDCEHPIWSYFVMHDSTTFTKLSYQEWVAIACYFGEPTLHKFGTTASCSVEHLTTLLNLETV